MFNQGTNSIKLIRGDTEAMGNLKKLIAKKSAVETQAAFVAPLISENFKVVFDIITHKDKNDKSINLPLFSRISLMRCIKELKNLRIDAEYCFIEDKSNETPGKKKKTKPKDAAV